MEVFQDSLAAIIEKGATHGGKRRQSGPFPASASDGAMRQW